MLTSTASITKSLLPNFTATTDTHYHYHPLKLHRRPFLLSPRASTTPSSSPLTPPIHHHHDAIADIVTLFDRISAKSRASCEGKGFYTRAALLEALASFPGFGRTGSVDDSRREIAGFFAHATIETGHFCYIEQINGLVYCDEKHTEQYPCNAEKKYLGRGPLQLTWNYNYGVAGKYLGFDLLNSPDLLARDPVLCFKASLWFWMTYVQHLVLSGKGFGSTIRVINPGVCNGRFPCDVNGRVKYYLDYCRMFDVSPGDDLYC